MSETLPMLRPETDGPRRLAHTRKSRPLNHTGDERPVGTTFRSRAPLRISFAGGGTDVSPFPEEEGGLVLSATIGRYAYASLKSRSDEALTIHSVDFDTTVHYESREHVDAEGKLELIKAAIAQIGVGGRDGFDLFLKSSAPPGSGLGSSSTVVVALIGVLSAHYGLVLDAYEVAALAHMVERHDLAIPGGKQDHYAAAFGGFNFIEFDGQSVLVNPLRIRDDIVDELQHNLLLVYTGMTRASGQIIEDQTARVSDVDGAARAALRAQKDLALEMKRLLLRGRLHDFGGLLDMAWQQKKQLSTKISTPQIDEVYELACANGAIGGKVTGAGGGGHMLLYCDFYRRHRVAQALEAAGMQVFEVTFTPEGLKTWRTGDV